MIFMVLQYNGERGVQLILGILKGEFARCMQLAGYESISEISPVSLGIFVLMDLWQGCEEELLPQLPIPYRFLEQTV